MFHIAVSIELLLIHASNRKLHERPKCSGDRLMCLITCGNEGHILISKYSGSISAVFWFALNAGQVSVQGKQSLDFFPTCTVISSL